MNGAELLIILVVALIVFGPSKLPMLATHLGMLMRKINSFKTKATALWDEQLKEIQLLDNERKANQADEQYKNDNKSSSG